MRDRFGTPDPTPAVVDVDGRSQPGRHARRRAEADRDGDGVPDARDNCPAAGNASQADKDGDGVGDACETAPRATPPVTGERVVARCSAARCSSSCRRSRGSDRRCPGSCR